MELWIRSQDKRSLKKVDTIEIYEQDNGCCRINDFGFYETKERALSVLDEIQSKIRGSYILKTRDKKTIKDMLGIFKTNEVRPIEMEITHINEEVIIYEMPEE